MQVEKRDGTFQPLQTEKIKNRLLNLCNESEKLIINFDNATEKIAVGLPDGEKTSVIDTFAAETCAAMVTTHPVYQDLAARIIVSKAHKETKSKFSEVFTDLYNDINPNTNKKSTLLADDVYEIVMNNADTLDSVIDYSRDYSFGFFGFKTLENSYLLKVNGVIAERPQHLFMRVAVGIHKADITSAIETYHLLSEKWFIHATPTLFNAGMRYSQLSSCFLLTMKDDSIEGIFDTVKECAMISKFAGGIGLNVHCIRSQGSRIEGTNGQSNGLIPMLQVFNSTARYVDQGGNKRPGAIAIYVEPWHADIMDFLQMRKNHGDESRKARDLFLGLWVPDLLMKRVQEDGNWTLMDPNKCRGLFDCWGEEFEQLYDSYEKSGLGVRTIKARALWKEILDSQIETGTPYLLYKDACNRKSNQQNLGTIKCSNLCTEIVEYSSADETAVCNLASVSLPRFVDVEKKSFDFEQLIKIVGVITNNLNKIIDVNHYPVIEAKRSNLRNRPIGIGVQGLADVFAMLRYPFDSKEAKELNKRIFETIYFGALTKSCQLAMLEGPYESYAGSPVSKGILQHDMWNVKGRDDLDWTSLRADIAKYGVRNSLLVAPMPTASTAQILGNNECFEPFTNNIYVRRVLSGEFVVINKYLFEDLLKENLWSATLKNAILANRGSIQFIDGIPAEIKSLYRTVWEIPQAEIIKMAADRAAFIDQSQSMNLHVDAANYGYLTALHMLSWKRGLKTGMYYLRTRPAADPIQFTVDRTKLNNVTVETNDIKAEELEKLTIKAQEALACSLANKDACTACQG